MEFASVFSALRRENGLSQRKVAGDLNISQALLSHYEKGIREPRLEFVEKACAYYGVTADYMLGMGGIRENPLPVRGPEDEELWGSREMRQQLRAVDLVLRAAAAGQEPEAGAAAERCIVSSLGSLLQSVLSALGDPMTAEDRLRLERERLDALCALSDALKSGGAPAEEELELMRESYRELIGRLQKAEGET